VDTPAAERPVGATWMTREDRLNEIDDYVAYLDAVAMEVVARLRGGRWPSRVVVLGFSQGTATAVRWVGRGTTRPTHLVLWGGFPPPEMLSREQSDGLHGVSLRVVVGSRDPFVSTDRLAEEERRLREAGLPYELIRYDGGHGIGGVTLRELARTFATPA
jgi:predicted esterase